MKRVEVPGVRAWLLVTVKPRPGREISEVIREASKVVLDVAMDHQWDPKWTIKRIDTIDPEGSQELKEFAPKIRFSLFITVQAANRVRLLEALRNISNTLHDRGFSDGQGHIVTNSNGIDMP